MVGHGVEPEELQAYLDAELEPARQAEVAQHLRVCRACAELVDDLRQVSAALQRWQVKPAPFGLRLPIPAEKPRRWFDLQFWWGLAASAAVVLLLVSVNLPDLLKRNAPGDGLESPAAEAPAPPPSAQDRNSGRTDAAEEVAEPAPGVVSKREAQAPPSRAGAAGEMKDASQTRTVTATVPPTSTAEKTALKKDDKQRQTGRATGQEGASREFERKNQPERDVFAQQALPSADEVPLAGKRAVGGLSSVGNFPSRPETMAQPGRMAYRAALTIQVKEFGAARQAVEETAKQAGGSVVEAGSAEAVGQRQRIELTLQVPAENLPGALNVLRRVGWLISEQVSGEDVTSRVALLEAQLQSAQAGEQRLRAAVNEPRSETATSAEAKPKVARMREELDRLQAQRDELVQRAAQATIHVVLVKQSDPTF